MFTKCKSQVMWIDEVSCGAPAPEFLIQWVFGGESWAFVIFKFLGDVPATSLGSTFRELHFCLLLTDPVDYCGICWMRPKLTQVVPNWVCSSFLTEAAVVSVVRLTDHVAHTYPRWYNVGIQAWESGGPVSRGRAPFSLYYLSPPKPDIPWKVRHRPGVHWRV